MGLQGTVVRVLLCNQKVVGSTSIPLLSNPAQVACQSLSHTADSLIKH